MERARYNMLHAWEAKPFSIVNVQLHAVVLENDSVPYKKSTHQATAALLTKVQQPRVWTRDRSTDQRMTEHAEHSTETNWFVIK